MARIALAIAYDGARFESYARQPGHRTVEGELIRILRDARVFADAKAARFRSASRTDAGVSAAWNVVAFDTVVPPPAAVAAGSDAPEGLILLSAAAVPALFEPRHARRRRYRYALESRWDWVRLRGLARSFEGEHDFSNFCRREPGRTTLGRVDRLAYRAADGEASVEVDAPAFQWQQVRRLVAALQAVQDGDASVAEVRRALHQPARRADFGVAPAGPLLLTAVEYEGLAFPAPPRVARDRVAREVGEARRRYAWAVTTRGNLPTTRR